MADYTPDRDASLGLVFRLNSLWTQADYAVDAVKWEKWDAVLDRIFCNLSYRGTLIVEKNKDGEVSKVDLSPKDAGVYNFLSKQIHLHKYKYQHEPKIAERSKARSRWYHALQKKDIWLRKLMMDLGLYLKETKNSPERSMFGNLGGKKKY